MRIFGHVQTPPPPLYAFVCISVEWKAPKLDITAGCKCWAGSKASADGGAISDCLKSGHSQILKMFNLIFKLFIYIVYNHWHALSIDLQSTWEIRTIHNRGFCVSFLSEIAGLGGCDVTGRVLKFKTNTQIMLLSWQKCKYITKCWILSFSISTKLWKGPHFCSICPACDVTARGRRRLQYPGAREAPSTRVVAASKWLSQLMWFLVYDLGISWRFGSK